MFPKVHSLSKKNLIHIPKNELRTTQSQPTNPHPCNNSSSFLNRTEEEMINIETDVRNLWMRTTEENKIPIEKNTKKKKLKIL
jgi:hypothetical protein